MRWFFLIVAAVVLGLSGCGAPKAVAPNTDPEFLKREQEKLDKMKKESGETQGPTK